jgi:xylan 1,4-beta-xylosidase
MINKLSLSKCIFLKKHDDKIDQRKVYHLLQLKIYSHCLFMLLALLAGYSFAQDEINNITGIPDRVINIDLSKEKGPLNTMFKECVGAGRANEGLRADWQQQLAYVKKECGF